MITAAAVLQLSRGGEELLDVAFRPARPEDVDGILDLSAPHVAAGALLPRRRTEYEERVGDFFVLEADGTLVACAGAARCGGRAEIYNFAVHEGLRGRAFGGVLLASLLAELHARAVREVVLFSGTAAGWFERHGFERLDAAGLPAGGAGRTGPARGSVPLGRTTTGGFDAPDVLGRIAGLTVRFARSGTAHRWDPRFDSLLQFADHHGIEVDSRCWAGVCGTCRTSLTRGTVSCHTRPCAELEESEMLLCTATPVSDLVLDL
ncbi:GNAT family N-acetyltransferase [Streptacidiphilus rugosus]|uniref:GNAT family N-acetyltransferase n=1 Tax=Streptacidiphilus rugosus TaxID=405783 RepID=UPI00068F209B|nr:GNAT family N-acetyltransferase [Streptacidiphilus rugosus]